MHLKNHLQQTVLYHPQRIWVYVYFASCLAQACRRTDSIKDYKFMGHVITRHVESNIWSCFKACRGERNCQSINYDVGKSICELNNRTKNRKQNTFVPLRGSVYVDNPFRARIGEEKDFPGLSCKDINESQEDSPSGEYWIDPSNTNNPFTVFCDMQTDRGGWTLIAQTVVRNTTSLAPMIREKNFRMIQNYSSGIVRIEVPALFQLKQLINFTQIRYYCRKNITSRTFHVMTKNDFKGKRVVKYFTEDPSVQPWACDSFKKFPDDNSYLATNCSKWGNDGTRSECDMWGNFKNKGNFRIYNDPIFWEGKYYVNLKPSVLACDDFYNAPAPLSPGDTWQLFVR